MGGLSLWHWLIVLVIVVLVFGTKRLKNVGQDLGEAVKGFKKGMQDDERDGCDRTQSLPPASPPQDAAPTPTARQRRRPQPAGRALTPAATFATVRPEPVEGCSISVSPNCW